MIWLKSSYFLFGESTQILGPMCIRQFFHIKCSKYLNCEAVSWYNDSSVCVLAKNFILYLGLEPEYDINICESVEGGAHDHDDNNNDGPENEDKHSVAVHDQR